MFRYVEKLVIDILLWFGVLPGSETDPCSCGINGVCEDLASRKCSCNAGFIFQEDLRVDRCKGNSFSLFLFLTFSLKLLLIMGQVSSISPQIPDLLTGLSINKYCDNNNHK